MDDNRPLGGVAGRPYGELVPMLERDRELTAVRAVIDQVVGGGQGAGFALTGESGAGKTTLVEAVCDDLAGVRVLRGHCDPLLTPRPLGPFRDLAIPQLDSVGVADTLLSEVCEQVYDALRAEPTVLVVEDLHWIDAASVDVLRFLARRVESMPLVLLMTYRDLEIDPRHHARRLLGDLATLDGFETFALAPLSVEGVEELVHGTRLDAHQVHTITGGNPFFVAEVAKEPELPMPTSVRDAVLARTAAVTQEDFEVLQLVATAPDRLDDRVLPALGVDLPTLRRLDDTSLLGRTPSGIVFRHELARQAVESTIPPGGSARLHARVLDAMERIGARDAVVLTHHAVAAHDGARATTYARQAALAATRAGAHTEAAAFFEIALEHLTDATAGERAELLLQLAFEQYMVSRLREAIDTARASFPLWQEAGDDAGLAGAHAAVGVYEYYNARFRRAEEHLDRASAIAESAGSRLVFGHARATRAYLAYQHSDVALAMDCLDQVLEVVGQEPEELLELRHRVIDDATALVGGDESARGRLFDHLESARAHGFDELVSTVYSNVSSLDVEHGRYRQAERVLEESLPFTVERDIPICRHWQTGVRSRLHFTKGHWDAALEDASSVLHHEGMPLALLWPHLVSALVPLRRGEELQLGELEGAWALAERLDEPLRRLAVLAALAEVMWMTERPDARVSVQALRDLPELATATGAGWAAGNLAAWLRRLGLDVAVPTGAAEPFRLLLEGRHAEAASWWHLAGDSFNEAMALVDSPNDDDRVRGVTLLDRLGAVGTADRIRVELRQQGLVAVPQRPRATTRANPGGLTNRQLDVARLVARGLSNNEIAARLFISPKTADHHVSAILAKLGLPNRRAVVVEADQLGLA